MRLSIGEDLVALAGPDNHQDVEEDVDHVQIEVQGREHVLLRAEHPCGLTKTQ